MKCPECGKECRRGVIKAKNAGSLTQFFTTVIQYSDGEKNKEVRKGTVTIELYAEGYYCDECMKVFAAFNEK